MPDKRQEILEYLRNTLLPTVKVANGYNHTIKLIERGHRSRNDMTDTQFPAVFIATTSEDRENVATMGNQTVFVGKLQIGLIFYVKSTKTNQVKDGTAVQLDLDKLIADLTKAINTDLSQGIVGLHKTKIARIDTDVGDLLPVAGGVMTVIFEYNTQGVTP